MNKAVAFDLEIARIIPEGESLDDHHPLGISVAAVGSFVGDSRTWHGESWRGPTHRMDAPEARELVDYLTRVVALGGTIVTWNGLGFDFRVLAEESGMVKECVRLAVGHIDLMYHFFCLRGFAIGLQAAADGLGVEGKSVGVSGADAPRLWAEGEYDTVIGYVGQDVQATMNVYRAIIEKGRFSWVTKRGGRRHQEIGGGKPLRVHEAMALEEPDVSWMRKTCVECGLKWTPYTTAVCKCGSMEFTGGPWRRSKFDGWVHHGYD